MANTAWQDSVNMGQVEDVIFRYGTDTVSIYSASGNELLEMMMYTIQGDSLTWKKVSGNSPCDTQTVGIYQVSIKNGEMAMKLVKDDCPPRLAALLPKPFKKIAYSSK